MRKLLPLLMLAVLALAALPSAAFGDEGFGLKNLDVGFANEDGSPAVQAGSHPFDFTVSFDANTTIDPSRGEVPIGSVKDLKIEAPPGLVGNPTAVPRCSSAVFLAAASNGPRCPDDTVVGVTDVVIGVEGPEHFSVPVYNMEPAPGSVLKLGFLPNNVPVTLEANLADRYPYSVIVNVANIAQGVLFYGATTTLWGNPSDSRHDEERGRCLDGAGSCPGSQPERPFLTMPRSCAGPLRMSFAVDSWQAPGQWLPPYLTETHDSSSPPSPLGLAGCGKLGFAPRIDSQATTDRAESPSGLDFSLDISDEGLSSPSGLAQSDIKKAVVTLPRGVTANPSLAGGLDVCSEAGFNAEALSSLPGQGCPQAAKIGTVEVETPLLEGALLKGQVFVAKPYQNPFGSLISLYMVIRDPQLGVLVKLPGKVEPDPRTGQLVTTFGESPYEIPQFPFSHFRFHFREGGRSPLVTPPLCGNYETKTVFTPWADPSSTYETTSTFGVTRGPNGGPCPSGGIPRFTPGFSAGSINNNAGSYSPFSMRLTREDGEQDMTKFSSILPPGVVGKLAGLGRCAQASVEAAKTKTGTAELASPSCPASSRIGSTLGGAGVGSELTYVPGSLYLGGPYHGDPLSVVAIVPAVAGPFDVGTVVVQVALTLNPDTAEVEVDGAASDPIPHILAGIPLKVRELRINVDRPEFTLNPTSCDPSRVRATLWGDGADIFNPADDLPAALSERFQAANCSSLDFKPKLSLKLTGGVKRGAHPALKAVVKARPGDANFGKAIVTLPHSAFLEQAHIRTVCTRVQFAADACPAGSIYGHARATTPLLDEPLEGPVYLRSSSHPLPDLVAALHGIVDINVVGRIDSKKARIRSTFAGLPDAPVSRFVLEMQGGKKGLIVNSRNLCTHKSRAIAKFTGQNGKVLNANPRVKPSCKKKKSSRVKRTTRRSTGR